MSIKHVRPWAAAPRSIHKMAFNVVQVFGRCGLAKRWRWQICMRIMKLAGCHPWINPTAWQALISEAPERKVISVDGQVFNISLEDTAVLGFYLFREHEVLVRKLLRAHIRKGYVVYDVGANIGTHSLYCACLAGNTGEIHAFEPVETTADSLRRHIQLNGSAHIAPIHLHKVGLGSDKGKAVMFLLKAISGQGIDSGSSTTIRDATPKHRVVTESTVSMDRLDNYVITHSLRPPNIIKCDVEGGEWNFYKGAKETISRYLPILLFEWNPGPRTYDGTLFAEELNSLGYKPFPLRYRWLRRQRYKAINLATYHGDVAFFPANILDRAPKRRLVGRPEERR